MYAPIGMRCASWSRSAGSGRVQCQRPYSAGETATIAWSARIVSPSSVRSSTPSPSCSTAATGVRRRTASPSWLGQAVAQLLAAADEVVLLRAALELGQRGQPATRLQIEEEVQERQLLDLGAEHELRGEVEEHPRILRAQVTARERVDGLRIPVGDRGVSPRVIDGHLLPQPVEPQLGDAELGDRERREREGSIRETRAAARATRALRGRPGAGARFARRARAQARQRDPGSARSSALRGRRGDPPRPRSTSCRPHGRALRER